MHALTRMASAAIALAGAAGLSCAGPDESPIWSPSKAQYDPYGNAALLSPANDSRVNLLLLLAAGQRKPGPADLGPRTFFAWNDLRDAIDPTSESNAFAEPSRCQTLEGGARDFLVALAASKAGKAEKSALAEARNGLAAACDGGAALAPSFPQVGSPSARGFRDYLDGAFAFYAGRFPDAAASFARLANAPDPWLREAGLYMRARTALNAAQASAFDEYGNLSETPDRAALAEAETGFDAYLSAYPRGRYAASALGLLRRVHWLAHDEARLAANYAAVLARPSAATQPTALRLAEEIDYKLPSARSASAGPMLLAVSDLQRMRLPSEFQDDGAFKPIGTAELAGQAEAFRGSNGLYAFVRAAHAFHVARQPREVLRLIPDDARKRSHDALSFSRQMLRGLALDALRDRNARGFWLELIGATVPGQRGAVELALARHDETAGDLARVFAPDSQVRDPIARAILLERVAPPALLRQQATRGDAHERSTALAVLLAKELTRGFYADFLRDLTLVPSHAPSDGYFAEANAFSSPDDFRAVEAPTGIFIRGPLGEYGCPALRQTVATLERSPLAPTARLCLGEFLRENGFDWFPFDQPLPEGLGSSRPLFPGTPITRQTIYRGVMADPKAGPSDKAYALFRAVRCYAPAGINGCGGADAPLGERKAWFQRLKRDYPQSRWARELKYYW